MFSPLDKKIYDSVPDIVASLREYMLPSQQTMDMGGQPVHIAQDQNVAGHRYDRQHDRYSVVALGNVPPDQYQQITRDFFEKLMIYGQTVKLDLENPGSFAKEEALSKLDNLGYISWATADPVIAPGAPADLVAAYNAPVAKVKDIKEAGATCTTMLYNPVSFSLEVGSVGDSPAYMVLADQKGNYDIRRIARAGKRLNATTTKWETSTYTNNNHPERFAYSPDNSLDKDKLVPVSVSGGHVPLQPVIDDIVKHSRLDTKAGPLQVSLVLASDGIEGLKENVIAQLVKFGVAGNDPNIAQAIIKEALQSSRDNQNIIVIPDIKQGKGEAIAACLADGMGDHGYIHAHSAVKIFETAIAHHREQAQLRSVTP